jgi:RHH-type proline utilization regulon transcriptional repressor/proline dehydrogenase/delta 1-pyrroline-5-carboxylate dehydrogenase
MKFENVPYIDFTEFPNIENYKKTLNNLKDELYQNPKKVPVIIDGKEIFTNTKPSKDPSTNETIAEISWADINHVNEALKNLDQGFSSWSNISSNERINIINKAADLMEEDRFRLAALITIEAGKPWKEADADVAEAIDFCRYYAIEMQKLSTPRKTAQVLGEHSQYFYQPRGIAVVIAPWNFPLAILCGMSVAALVTGNVVAMKPAEQTSLIAYELAKILYKAGIPNDALCFLPGDGEVVGKTLVESSKTDMICFTGSRAVGLQILKSAAEIKPTQKSIKKVIAELGGKNAIIVDEDADLDEAIKGILYSAFGFSGQKCSACSRVIAVGSAYEPLLERLSKAALDIIIGSAHDSGIYLGPVIDEETQKRLLSQIEKAKQEFKCIASGESPNQHGYFVPVHIFKDVPFNSWLWKDELFGPVLACAKVATFEDAISEAINSEYALTGGVYSRSPANIEYSIKAFKVGNLYINRGCTGAIVERHPFGGFKMSGVGSKAGGPDYLLQFLEPRTVTENTMRRGFTPDL